MNDASNRRILEEDWAPSGIDDLEAAAWDALRSNSSVSLAAGPGSGKTEFLAQKAAFLLQTRICPDPQKILAISFKRDAAKNLARRVETRVPNHGGRFVSLTFDAFTKSLVDRFGASLPAPWTIRPGQYDLAFWTQREVGDILASLNSTAPPERRSEFYGVQGRGFLPESIGMWELPLDPDVHSIPGGGYPSWAWWDMHVLSPTRPKLDFTMLNRLAELLIRNNPRIRRAIRVTYPYVFVDEFQDTTGAQITFLESLFAGSGATLTAVGDRKQRIMRFAGALEDAMSRFETSFGASHFDLVSNFRSSAELVHLQHQVATELDPNLVAAISQARLETGNVAATIWTFRNEQVQATAIAKWIAEDIAVSNRNPSDFAILAKQKIADFEDNLVAALSVRGISLRNDDARYEEVALIDLLRHDASAILLGLLRLAVHPVGLGQVWADTLDLLILISGTGNDENSARATADHLNSTVRELRTWLTGRDPQRTTGEALLDEALNATDRPALTAYFSGQNGSEPLFNIVAALAARINTVRTGTSNWDELLAAVAAEDAVSLMTIHRSKGLEFHTVFVLGLDEDQWWSYRQDVRETTSAFFVALSRAKHRIIVTRATTNTRGQNTSHFYELLEQAGVEESAPE